MRKVLLGSCVLLSSCDSCEVKLPAKLASSRHIEYYTWAYPDGLAEEGAVVCMDDKLAEMDRFVEFVAAALEVDVPTEPIRYVWVPPEHITSDTWNCPESAVGCFDPDGPGGRGVVLSIHIDLFHELVHAVETPALGRSHPLFEEGMANYLSTAWSSAEQLEEFPAALKAGVAPGKRVPGVTSMHFVGALIERGGLAKYKEVRRRVDYEDGLPELAAAYEVVYGGSLDQFLVDASSTPIVGLGANYLCGQAPAVSWDTSGPLDMVLNWACGDGATFGINKTFGTAYALDVAQEGYHRMTLSSVSGGPVFAAMLDSCPAGGEGGYNVIFTQEGASGPGILSAGRYTLTVSLQSGPEMKGDMHLVFE